MTLEPDDILKLFIRFHATWGQRWHCNVNNEENYKMTKAQWYHALKHVSLSQLKCAYDACSKTLDWPPSLPEFLKTCRLYDPTLSQTTPLLNHDTPSTPEIARQHINQCFAILGITPEARQHVERPEHESRETARQEPA